MTDRDRLAADLLEGIEQAWQDDLLYGGNAEALDPSGWTRSTFPEAAKRLADRLIALGWTRHPVFTIQGDIVADVLEIVEDIDEERLARALGVAGDAEGMHYWCKDIDGCCLDSDGRDFAAAIAKAYREDTDATD